MHDETKIRVVGRRNPSDYHSGGLKAAENLLLTVRQLRGNQPFVPRGVHRFKSHQESDEWMMRMLTRPNAAPL